MGTGGIISAIIAELIIGALALLVLPGRQPLGILLTLLVGVVGAPDRARPRIPRTNGKTRQERPT